VYRDPDTEWQRRALLTGGVAQPASQYLLASVGGRSGGDIIKRGGLTVYGCERDEADAFGALCPRFGIVPTMTSVGASVANAGTAAGNRCISVGHKSEISARTLRALHEAGVEHISTRSIGFDHIDLQAADDLGLTVENVV
jgi:D-specific alpha-keto acid dehydrogenase